MDLRYESSITLSNPEYDLLRNLNSMPWITSHDPQLDAKDRQVQRSVSLKLDSRPTYRLSVGKDRDVRDINGNFELAHLLARASSWDAKLMKELQEEEQTGSQINLENLPDWTTFLSKRDKEIRPTCDSKPTEISICRPKDLFSKNSSKESVEVSPHGVTDKVALPLRYRQILARRRAGRTPQAVTPTSPTSSLTFLSVPYSSGAPGGEALSSIHRLDVLPEAPDDPATVGPNENPPTISSSFDSSLTARQKDAKSAILWTHQEIRMLKQQNRSLLRQLLDLGAQIHRLGGLESCQSVSGHLGHSTSVTSCCSGDHSDVTEPIEESLTTSLVTINIQPSAPPRRSLGPLSFSSIDHFFHKD